MKIHLEKYIYAFGTKGSKKALLQKGKHFRESNYIEWSHIWLFALKCIKKGYTMENAMKVAKKWDIQAELRVPHSKSKLSGPEQNVL